MVRLAQWQHLKYRTITGGMIADFLSCIDEKWWVVGGGWVVSEVFGVFGFCRNR